MSYAPCGHQTMDIQDPPMYLLSCLKRWANDHITQEEFKVLTQSMVEKRVLPIDPDLYTLPAEQESIGYHTGHQLFRGVDMDATRFELSCVRCLVNWYQYFLANTPNQLFYKGARILTVPEPLPGDLRRIGYPEGAEDNPVHRSLFRSPSMGRWYGIMDNSCFAIADESELIRDILVGDAVSCRCGTLFYSEEDRDRHSGVHAGEMTNAGISSQRYEARIRVLSWDEVRENVRLAREAVGFTDPGVETEGLEEFDGTSNG